MEYIKSTSHKQEEYSKFVTNVRSYLKTEGLIESHSTTFSDHYRLFGSQSLDSESPRDRLYIFFSPKHWYFEDVKTYNAFVRIRKEHIKKMAGAVNVAEIDFYQVRNITLLTYLVP